VKRDKNTITKITLCHSGTSGKTAQQREAKKKFVLGEGWSSGRTGDLQWEGGGWWGSKPAGTLNCGWRCLEAGTNCNIPPCVTTFRRISISQECGDLFFRAHRIRECYSPNAARTEHVLDKNPGTDASGFNVEQEAHCRFADCWQGQL